MTCLLLDRFQLRTHAAWTAWESDCLLKKWPITQSGKHGSARMARHIFYRCDLLTLFDSQPAVQTTIDRHHGKMARASQKEEPDPLVKAVADCQDDAAKAPLLHLQYAFKHFREGAQPGDVFLVPRHQFGSLSLPSLQC